MKTRLERKNNKYIQHELKGRHGLFDLLDNVIVAMCRMDDEEYGIYNDIATEEEIELIIKEQLTFSEKRKLITILTTKIYLK